MARFFTILSIDGGGIRGVFASRILHNIEQDLKPPVAAKFDMLSGTSTGSIIAACLSLNYTCCDIVNFYLSASRHIFKRRLKFTPKLIEKALHSPYDNDRLKVVLRHIMGKKRLYDVHIPLVIPATNIKDGSAYIFSSFENSRTHRVYEAVMASCAAPTFFDPVVIDGKLLADGGLHANNPSALALTKSLSQCGVKLENIKILSIGTGHFNKCYDHETVRWGLINGWKVRTLTEFVASVQSQTTYERVRELLPPGQLLRINFEQDNLISPDDFSKMEDLVTLADEIYAIKKAEILDFLG